MSTMKSSSIFLLCVFIIFFVLVPHVDNVPLNKVSPRPTTKSFHNATPIPPTKPKSLKKKSTGRDARFFGKLSAVVGLGLPEPVIPSISHRDDSALDHHRVQPTHYVTSYNFPPSRWGPYVAAVYEPSPVLSFFENPLAYLAAILNPYNWFGYTGSVSTSSPENFSTASPDRNQSEVVVYVHNSDNDIPNEEQDDFENRVEMKIELDNRFKEKIKKLISLTTTRLNSSIKTSTPNGDDADLIAEETTVKVIQADDGMQSDESEQSDRNPDTTRATYATTYETTVRRKPTTETEAVNSTATTESITTTTHRTTSSTVTSNPYYHHGYYYYGNPQSVSHVEFTTQQPVVMNAIAPVKFQNFNEISQTSQDSQNYFDIYDQQSQATFDQSSFNQLPPLLTSYTSSNFQNSENLRGFKPSLPLYF